MSCDLRHQFSCHLSFRSQYQFETYNQEIGKIFPQIGQYVVTTATALIRRLYRDRNIDARGDRTCNERVADFATGPLRHKAFGGTDSCPISPDASAGLGSAQLRQFEAGVARIGE